MKGCYAFALQIDLDLLLVPVVYLVGVVIKAISQSTNVPSLVTMLRLLLLRADLGH